MEPEEKDTINKKLVRFYNNTLIPTSSSILALGIVFILGFIANRIFGVSQEVACFIVILYWVINIAKSMIEIRDEDIEGEH